MSTWSHWRTNHAPRGFVGRERELAQAVELDFRHRAAPLAEILGVLEGAGPDAGAALLGVLLVVLEGLAVGHCPPFPDHGPVEIHPASAAVAEQAAVAVALGSLAGHGVVSHQGDQRVARALAAGILPAVQTALLPQLGRVDVKEPDLFAVQRERVAVMDRNAARLAKACRPVQPLRQERQRAEKGERQDDIPAQPTEPAPARRDRRLSAHMAKSLLNIRWQA